MCAGTRVRTQDEESQVIHDGNVIRRPKRRFENKPAVACPTDSCLVCRTLARIDPAVKTFVNQRANNVPLSPGTSVPDSAFADGTITIVRSGMVICQRLLNDGRRIVFDFVHPGEPLSLGYMARGINAFAAIPSQLCIIPEQTASALKQLNPAAAIELSELALGDRDRCVEHTLLLGRFCVSEKVAYFLHNMASRSAETASDGMAVDLPMSREDIADYLGVNVETVSRQFSALKKQGIIRLPRPDRVEIPDLQALKSMLPFTPKPRTGAERYSFA